MSAPAIRERWYARRGGGAWAKGPHDAEPRRIRVSGVAAVEDAQLLYGSGASIERSGRAPGFRGLRHEVWRERGFGDFWGYALVAEGAAEAMIEIGVNPWDLAAPEVVVDEAGGLLTDLDGQPRIDGLEVLATNGILHEEVLARLRRPEVSRVTGLMAAWRQASLEARLGLIAGIDGDHLGDPDPRSAGPGDDRPRRLGIGPLFPADLSGQRLESFVPTTPKPLLTLEYGLAWAGMADWRELVWLTIAAFGVGAGRWRRSSARLARRSVGEDVPGVPVAAHRRGVVRDGRAPGVLGRAARGVAREFAGLGARLLGDRGARDHGERYRGRGSREWRCSSRGSAGSRHSRWLRSRLAPWWSRGDGRPSSRARRRRSPC